MEYNDRVCEWDWMRSGSPYVKAQPPWQLLFRPQPLSRMIRSAKQAKGAHHAFPDQIAGRTLDLSGWNRVLPGWFSLSGPSPDAKGNKVNVNLSVDEGKMKADVKEAGQKVKQEIKELEGKAKAKEAK